jgi:hypothetical protein
VHFDSFGIDEEKEQQNPIVQFSWLLFAADIMSARAISDGSEGCTALHLEEDSIILVRDSKQCTHTFEEHFLQVTYLMSPCLQGVDCRTFLVDSCWTLSGEQQIQPGDHIDTKIQMKPFHLTRTAPDQDQRQLRAGHEPS